MKDKKLNITNTEKKQCHTVIHTAATAAGAAAAGLAQIPLADSTIITPIQIGMIVKLGKIFDRDVNEGFAKGFLSSALATMAGRGVTQVAIGWIPLIGNAINATTAAGITEAIGWVAVADFASKRESIESDDLEMDQAFDFKGDLAEDQQTEEEVSFASEFEKLFEEDVNE